MSLPNIILLGHINSGKTTIANYLRNRYHYNTYALGTGVKQFVVDLYQTLHDIDSNIQPIRYADLNDRRVKEQYRPHMQKISTEVVRKYFGGDVWVRYLDTQIDHTHPYIIDDIRFKNEFNYYSPKCMSIRVRRDDETANQHISEHDVDDVRVDCEISNNGTLDDLYNKIDALFSFMV